MPVNTTTPVNTYIANGATSQFDYEFRILNADQLNVFVDGELQEAGYTVDLATIGNDNGGFIEFALPPAADAIVRLERITPIERQTDYVEGGGLNSSTLDDDFDNLVMSVQEVDRRTLQEDSGGEWDAESKVIKNLADPINDQDSATKHYVDTASDSPVAAAITAAASAASSATSAATSATNAASSATSASSSASAAATSATNAETSLSDFQSQYVSQASEPSGVKGKLWYDEDNDTMKVYNGSTWDQINFEEFTIQFTLPTGTSRTYTLLEYSSLAFTVDSARVKTNSGTVTVTIKINGTDITGLSSINIGTTQTSATATDDNAVSVGDRITAVFSNPNNAQNVAISLKCTKQ